MGTFFLQGNKQMVRGDQPNKKLESLVDVNTDGTIGQVLTKQADGSFAFSDNGKTNEEIEDIVGAMLGVGISTRAEVFDSNTAGENTFTSDTKHEYIDNGTESYFHPIPLVEDTLGTGSNAGVFQGMPTRYNDEYITNMQLLNCGLSAPVINSTGEAAENMMKTEKTSSGASQLQFYTNNRWLGILTGVSLQEDNNFRLEFQPFGTDFWIEAHTGNSNSLGTNGRPIIQEYNQDTGPNPVRRVYSGANYDGGFEKERDDKEGVRGQRVAYADTTSTSFLAELYQGEMVVVRDSNTSSAEVVGVRVPAKTSPTSGELLGMLVETSVPSSSSDTGYKGQYAMDGSYLYLCRDTDTWERIAWDGTAW